MQIKTTLIFHLTPVRIAIARNTTKSDVGEDVGEKNSHTLLVGMQTSATTLENNYGVFLKN
jgi:hypothetical protein